MNFFFISVCNFSILIAGIFALLQFTKMDKAFYPFVFFLWAGCLNEVLSFILILNGKQTLLNSNIYVLIEAVLLSWFFKEMRLLKNQRKFTVLLIAIVLVWIAENFIFGSITRNSTLFRIFYSFIVVILSINLVSKIIFSSNPIFRNSAFLLSICFIIYFTYKALFQAFVIYGFTKDMRFLVRIYFIMIYINLGVNLLYAVAVIWTPRKVKYLLQLS
jgi:hypothetical protein